MTTVTFSFTMQVCTHVSQQLPKGRAFIKFNIWNFNAI